MNITSVLLSGFWERVSDALSNYWARISKVLPGALGNTIVGISVVFVALLFISFIISLFKYISVFENRRAKKKEEKQKEEAIPVQAIENTVAQIAEAEELTDDLALIAVITAAIQAYEEANGNVAAVANGLVVRSIRRAPKKVSYR
ncbi:MAG: OadG family protein [Lachnospiraceae bacterium]|nr:OadG family protein [Lachnospiraceae bacterium]